MTEQLLVATVARALAKKEGWFDRKKTLTLPQTLANPAMLKHWKNKAGEELPNESGFVQFPACSSEACEHADHPAEVGWRAARAQVRINVVKRGLTFFEFFAGRRRLYDGFANAREGNDPADYALFVAGFVTRELGLRETPDVASEIRSLL